jgi:hypothetical protein
VRCLRQLLPKPPFDAASLQIYLLAPNHEEDVKRLEQDRSDTKKSEGQMFSACRFRNSRQPGLGRR